MVEMNCETIKPHFKKQCVRVINADLEQNIILNRKTFFCVDIFIICVLKLFFNNLLVYHLFRKVTQTEYHAIKPLPSSQSCTPAHRHPPSFTALDI